jgi:hypothetical protein
MNARRRPGTPGVSLQETKKTGLSKSQNPRNREHQVEDEQRAWESTSTDVADGGVIVVVSIPPVPPRWRWPRRTGSIVGGLPLPCHLSLASATTAPPRID